MAKKGRKGNIKVIQENKSGRNKKFKDQPTGRRMTRTELNKAIKNGTYSDIMFVMLMAKQPLFQTPTHLREIT